MIVTLINIFPHATSSKYKGLMHVSYGINNDAKGCLGSPEVDSSIKMLRFLVMKLFLVPLNSFLQRVKDKKAE